MKKLLLLFLAITVACSSSDYSENSSNNFNSPEKLISSMNVSSVDCSEGEMPNSSYRFNISIDWDIDLLPSSIPGSM